MKRITNTVALAILIMVVSCKSSKQNSKTNVVDKVEPAATMQEAPVEVTYADPAQQKKHEASAQNEASVPEKVMESSYPVTVSFYSIGEGTDGSAITRFKEFILEFNTKESVLLAYETNPWGREGEVDYCFKLEELDGKQCMLNTFFSCGSM